MSDIISRDEVIAHFQRIREASEEKGDYNKGFVEGLDYVISFILTMPSAEPRKHSHWVPIFNGEYVGGAHWFECAECGKIVAGGLQSDNLFCTKCGADMRDEHE